MFVKCADKRFKAGQLIKKVEFKLHETFRNPKVKLTKAPFALSMTGWGTFGIPIKIYWQDVFGVQGFKSLEHDLSFQQDVTKRCFTFKFDKELL